MSAALKRLEDRLDTRLIERGGSNFRVTDEGHENITEQVQAGHTFPEGRYLVASTRLARQGGWFGGKWYVDLLKPGVTEKFIEVTMEAYRREIGDQFGKRVPGWSSTAASNASTRCS